MPLNFIQLKAAIGDWLDTDEERLPSTVRGDILNMVMREFLRKHETRFGEHTDVFFTQAEKRDYDLFANWAKPINSWYLDPDTNQVVNLDYVNKDEFDRLYPISGLFGQTTIMGAGTFGEATLGRPKHWTVFGPHIQLGPVPDKTNISMFVNFWRLLPDLTDAAPTNDFTDKAWEYLLFASLAKAAIYGIEDERVPIWANEAKVIEKDLVFEHTRARIIPTRTIQSQEPG